MKARLAMTVVALISTGAVATADTVDLEFLGTGKGRNARISFGGSTQNVFAGQLRYDFSNGTGIASGFSGEMITFCTDLLEHVSSSTLEYEVAPVESVPGFDPMGADRAAAIRDLYRFAAGSQVDPGADRDFAAAFQLAVWEAVSDFEIADGRSSLDVEAGDFTAFRTNGSSLSSAVSGHLSDLFDAVGSYSGSGGGSTVLALRNDGAQDQLIETVIPTPMASMMGIAGLAGVTGVCRRRTC